MNNGALCISLDFEKYWGIHDISNINQTDIQFEKVHEIVDRLLNLFDEYAIHCTWAVVGLLNFKDINSLLEFDDNVEIPYKVSSYSPFPIKKHNLSKIHANHVLGFKEIERIKKETGQELASHTFSHYYAIENGQTINNFKTDLSLFNHHVGKVKSMVFPRNQVNQSYLNICSEYGIRVYRGNQKQWFWKNNRFQKEHIFQKVIRFTDAYIKLSKSGYTSWTDLAKNCTEMLNLPANRFFRSYNYHKAIERLKIRRIKNEMLNAAQKKGVYHLWWHPHNFSTNTEENFKQLEELLEYYNYLKKEYDFESLNMNEISCRFE